MFYQQVRPASRTVRDDDPKQVALAILILAYIYNLCVLYLTLFEVLCNVLSTKFNFFTIAAMVYIYHFFYSTLYFLYGLNKGYRLMRLYCLIWFIYLGLNILAMLILVFNEESTTEQVNHQIFVFMFAFSPWASMAAAVLNILKMNQNV